MNPQARIISAINNTIPITNGDNPCPLPNSNGNNNKLAHNATLMINPTAIKRSNGLFVITQYQ